MSSTLCKLSTSLSIGCEHSSFIPGRAFRSCRPRRPQASLGFCGPLWASMGFPEPTWASPGGSLGPIGPLWASLGLRGFSRPLWASLGHSRPLCASMGSSGLRWASTGRSRSRLASLGSSGQRWASATKLECIQHPGRQGNPPGSYPSGAIAFMFQSQCQGSGGRKLNQLPPDCSHQGGIILHRSQYSSGPIWASLGFYGHLWASPGTPWASLARSWDSMGISEPLLDSLGLRGLSGPLWASLGLSEPLRAALGLYGPCSASLGFSGLFWAVLGFSEQLPYLGSSRHLWASPGIPWASLGRSWDSMGFPGPI